MDLGISLDTKTPKFLVMNPGNAGKMELDKFNENSFWLSDLSE